MKRIIRLSMFLAVFGTLLAGSAFAQGGSRTFLERRVWYVEPDGKIGEAKYWNIFLGRQDVKVRQRFVGTDEMEVESNMNFNFVSSGYIEGIGVTGINRPGRGLVTERVSAQPTMRIRVTPGGPTEDIRSVDQIEYIYDYGRRVALRDGRKGEFLMGIVSTNSNLEVYRFAFTEFRDVNQELRPVLQDIPIVAIAFTNRDAAVRAAAEPVTDD